LDIPVVINSPKLVKDKHCWWLSDGRINIRIGFTNDKLMEENIKYLSELYNKIGIKLVIDREFGDSY
jgi:hypothetical protein